MSKEGINSLESEKLPRLLVKYCIPSLASSLVTSIYNIVDQLFIGQKLGINGNAATNVIFPVITLITSLSLMCGVGSSANMNLALGKNNQERARKVVGNGFTLMIGCGVVLSAIVLLFSVPVLNLLGCTETIMPYALPYARIVAVGFAFSLVGAAGPFLIRADGSPIYALASIAAGAVLNMILDALFVMGFDWGIPGAAWATVISQAVSAAMVLWYLRGYRSVKLEILDFLPDLKLTGNISVLGAGPAFNFMTQAMSLVFLNHALRTYGEASAYGSEVTLAVAGVANKVNTLAVAVVTGLTNGMQPIVSFNYGRKNYKRVVETAKTVIGIVLAAGFVIFLCYQWLPVQIVSLFGDGSELYFDFAKKYFRIYLMLICLNGLQSSVAGFFSAQGKPGKSILISLTRQVIFLTPLLVILPLRFGLNGVLAAGPLADFAMASVAVYLFVSETRKLKKMEIA
ncbi:MAG: MATE family efflux transporter [Brotaphodocola sp.]